SGSEATDANSSSASSSRGARRKTRSPVRSLTSIMLFIVHFLSGQAKLVYWRYMSIKLNHTIVAAKNKNESATFLTELFGLPDPVSFGHFLVVAVANDVSLDYSGVAAG